MKILFITPPPYLPNCLHRIRSFDFIRIFAEKNEVHLLSVTAGDKKSSEFEEIKKICKSITVLQISKIRAILNCLRFPYLPYEVAYCYSKDAGKEMEKIIKKEKIDIVYLKRLRSVIFFPKVKIPVVLDTTDAMSMFYQRMSENHFFIKRAFYFFESIKYKIYEKNVMKNLKNWIVCSNVDKEYLQKLNLNNKINISVVPNPVDTKYFSFDQSPVTNHSLLFRGLMDKPVNIDACLFFVNKIFPKVMEQVPDVKLFIVGLNPNSPIKKLHDGVNIFVAGFVKDVRKYFKDSSIVVCPIRIGSGTRHKILQAWAMGKPIVSTSIGSEGLVYEHGKNILIADDPESFAKKIILLFKDKKLYTKLARIGRNTAEKNYSFESIDKKINNVIKNVKKKSKKNQ